MQYGKAAQSNSFNFIRGKAKAAKDGSGGLGGSKTHIIAATMRIDRYYSSVREEVTKLSGDAAQLLTDEDYVGFFNACGPNYVRGIRRAQEITAVFEFSSSSREGARQFGTSLKTMRWIGQGDSGKTKSQSKFKTQSSSLKITLKGYGLGLSQEGTETLVATDAREFNAIMTFAYRTMIQIESTYNVGKVDGIEVVPWTHNVAFQNAAKLPDKNIERPLPRNLIPKAKLIDSTDQVTTFNSESDTIRKKFQCKGALVIDKFGHCCEPEQLIDITKNEYRTLENFDVKKDVCKPVQSLDASIIKDNMSNNAEFVSRLASAIRYRLVSLGTTERCISAANSIPDKFLDNLLLKNEAVTLESGIDTPVSVRHLKLAVDPKGDYSLLKHMGNELDEWIDMFYSPCLAAIYGMNVGSTPETDPMYFMADPWYSHSECMHLTCLSNNFRWDREKGGCEAALITLDSAGAYETDKDSKCSKDEELLDGTEEVCKHTTAELKTFQDNAKLCWTELPFRNVAAFAEHFCLPQVTKYKMEDGATKTALKTRYEACRPIAASTGGRRLAFETNYLNYYPSSDVQFLDEFEDDEDYDYMYDELKRIEASSGEEESDFFAELRVKMSQMRSENDKKNKLEEKAQKKKTRFAKDLKEMINTAKSSTLDK